MEELVDWKHLEKLEKNGLDVPPWILTASSLSRKVIAAMPASIRLHPMASRLVNTLRHIHSTLP